MLACIAFKQPIAQVEIDLLLESDERGLFVTIRDLRLWRSSREDDRLRFATTEVFETLRIRDLGGFYRGLFERHQPST